MRSQSQRVDQAIASELGVRVVRVTPRLSLAEWMLPAVLVLEVLWIFYWGFVLIREISTSLLRGVGL